MSFLNSTAPGAVGTTPIARGAGAAGARRSAGAGDATPSGGAFSTLLDRLSQPERARTQGERASAPAPVRAQRLAASRDAGKDRVEGRPARPAARSTVVSVAPDVAVLPVVEVLPRERSQAPGSIGVADPATEPGDGRVALGTEALPSALDGSLMSPASLPIEIEAIPPALRHVVGIDAPDTVSDAPSSLPVPMAQHAGNWVPNAAAPDARGGDVRSSVDLDLDVDADADVNAGVAALTEPPGAAHPGLSNADARPTTSLLDQPVESEAADLPEGPPGVAGGPERGKGLHHAPVPAVESLVAVASAESIAGRRGFDVHRTAETTPALERPGVQADASMAAPAVTDAALDLVPDRGAPDGQANPSPDNGGGRDDSQTGGHRLPEGVTAHASTFVVRSDVDGVAVGPEASDAPDASERALEGQLVQAMRVQWRGGLGEATITLRPEYLGQVRISLRLEGGALQAHLQVEDPKVRSWVESHVHVLKSGLAEQGLDLSRLVVSDQPSGGGRRDAAPDERGRRGRSPQDIGPATEGDDVPRFEVRV